MAYNNHYSKMQREGSVPHRITPQQQLWNLTDDSQHEIFRDVFRRIKKRDQEDLCYAMIAYIRFKILRPFESTFMQVLFQSFIDLVEGRINKNV